MRAAGNIGSPGRARMVVGYSLTPDAFRTLAAIGLFDPGREVWDALPDPIRNGMERAGAMVADGRGPMDESGIAYLGGARACVEDYCPGAWPVQDLAALPSLLRTPAAWGAASIADFINDEVRSGEAPCTDRVMWLSKTFADLACIIRAGESFAAPMEAAMAALSLSGRSVNICTHMAAP